MLKNKNMKNIFVLLVLILASVSVLTVAVQATGGSEYYMSYKKYKEAVNPDGTGTITYNDVTDQIGNLLNEGLRRYSSGADRDGDDGYYKPFSNSYGFWYETSGFEKRVMGYISGARVNEVELQFTTMIKAVNAGASLEEVKADVDTLLKMLRTDADILDDIFGYSKESGGGTGLTVATFFAVFSIIVREGLEAILIVGAMAAYLIKTGNKRGTRYVYYGAVIALVASVALAILLYSIVGSTSNSIPQEIVEGVTALTAVAVLIYVSNWMISKAEADAWSGYLSSKVSSNADNGKMAALGFTSFLAVFREGAEVILFCQQYFSSASEIENGYLAVFGGIIAGLLVVALIFVLIRVFGVKIPLKPFFTATSVLMAVMSIAFLGSGMFELFLDGGMAVRLSGWGLPAMAQTIPALKWMNGNELLSFFGVYPTWITLGPQLILFTVTVVTFILSQKKTAQNTPADKINVKSITVYGILSIIFSLTGILAFIGTVLGCTGVYKAKAYANGGSVDDGKYKTGKALSDIGVILSVVCMLAFVVIVVINGSSAV